jgi:hypothetical protein
MRNFLFAVLVLGCSSSTAGTTGGSSVTQADIDSYCAKSCAAQKKCNSMVDETTCTNNCKNQAASYAGKVRVDYVEYINQCVQTSSCDKISSCNETAKASIAPSSAAQTFCDELIKKHTECKFPDTDKARCLNTYKVFVDSALDSARTCLSKACGDYNACVLSTVGVRAG